MVENLENKTPENIIDEPLIKVPMDRNYSSADMSRFDSASNVVDQPTVGFFGTVMNLLNSLIGAEILSISRSMLFYGLTVSVVLMIFTAIISYITTILTVKLQSLTRAESLKIIREMMYNCIINYSFIIYIFMLYFIFNYRWQ